MVVCIGPCCWLLVQSHSEGHRRIVFLGSDLFDHDGVTLRETIAIFSSSIYAAGGSKFSPPLYFTHDEMQLLRLSLYMRPYSPPLSCARQ